MRHFGTKEERKYIVKEGQQRHQKWAISHDFGLPFFRNVQNFTGIFLNWEAASQFLNVQK